MGKSHAGGSAVRQLDEHLGATEELRNSMARTRAEIEAEGERESRARAENQVARDSLNSYLQQADRARREHFTEGNQLNPLDHWEKERLAELRKVASDADARLKESQRRYSELHEKYTALGAKLASLQGGGMQREHVLAHQQRVAGAARSVDALQRLIDEQEKQPQANPAPSHDFTQEMEDALAKVALGEGTPSEVEEIRARQAKALTGADAAARTAARNAATVQGLKRRLASAQAHLHELESKTPELVFHHLLSEAEGACSEYVKHAQALGELFCRLLALDRLARNYSKHGRPGRSVFAFGGDRLVIPAFRLPQCSKRESAKANELFDSLLIAGGIDAFLAREVERLRALGIVT
jgi:chromosome segregation ATPase